MSKKIATAALTIAAVAATLQPTVAAAQTRDDWHFDAIIYGYFPSISGKSQFPERTGGSSVDVDSDKIIDALKFAFMGTFEARKGRWGVLTDVLYMDLGGSKSRTRDLTIGGVPLPADVTANGSLDIKGTVWELAGTYRALAEPTGTLDLLGGVRMLDYRQTLGWEFSADLGPGNPSRSGSSEIKVTNWDAIVGAKGRILLGDDRKWYIPYYVDVGTGDSDFTWQVIGGVGYSFGWGDVLGGWRYLDYNLKSGSKIEGATFNGPMVGVAFHW
jgi:hypothetical protein